MTATVEHTSHLQPELVALLRELATMTARGEGVTLTPSQAELVLTTLSDQVAPMGFEVDLDPAGIGRAEKRVYMVPEARTLTLNGYQKTSLRTLGVAIHDPLLFLTTMLTSEAGEFAGLVQKHRWQGHLMDADKACLELGDIMWAVSGLAWTLGRTLGSVGRMNIVKLIHRFPDGFTSERSRNRQPGG